MALELFLSPLIKLVITKAADSLIHRYCATLGLEDNRQKLRRLLLAVQDKIADAESQGVHSAAVREWMKQLQTAAYQAADLLDEFQYEALRREALRQQPSSSAKVIKGFFSAENPVLFRQKMSNKLINVLRNIDEIVTEMNTFSFVPRDSVPSIDRETYSFVIESEIVGRDGQRDEIINTLMDPKCERDILVLSIVGMGGLGKTTLAQLVFNHERVQAHFELRLWVCVSTEFNIINILRSIIQVAKKEVGVLTSIKEVLQQQVREILDKKRYLLVLDDVWTEEREKWDELRTLLFPGARTESAVIVTTRSKGVASIVGTLPCYELALLTEEDSWRLFEKRAFGAWVKKPSDELIAIGKTIVRKCRGLPLAVKAMGGLICTKSDLCDWVTVAENKIWEGISSSENILPLLKLSYDHLPSYMQQCFAFCAVFPEDYTIERDTLIQLWLANDFIPFDGTMNLEDRGRHVFDELCWRSFFQNITEEDTSYGTEITCKMHDFVHNLATQVSQKKCQCLSESKNLEIAQEVQHIFVSNDSSLDSRVLKQFPIIRTLLVNSFKQVEKQDYSNLVKTSSLRALEFRSSNSPPKELGYMRYLRYLDLSYSHFSTLPESVCKLYNLQTLKLSDSEVRELPEGMRYLTNLRHLFLDYCANLERMPVGLGQLKCLQTLTSYIVDPERGVGIGELENLDLCGHLDLRGLEKVRDKRDAEVGNLSAKSKLHHLGLFWESTDTTRNNQAEVLEALRPPCDLKDLEINGYGGSNFPKWMKECLVIKNLRKLDLGSCINCGELPPVWQLPLLEDLSLTGLESLTCIVSGTCRNDDGSSPLITFPSLKFLRLSGLPNLQIWHERAPELVSFPNLNKLVIYECPKIKAIPMRAPLLACLQLYHSSEIKLHPISNLHMLSSLAIHVWEDLRHPETDVFRPPKALKEMTIQGFETLNPLEEDEKRCEAYSIRMLRIINSNCFFSFRNTELALEFWSRFATLEHLEIENCDGLVYFPEEEFSSLKFLKTLYIYGCESFTGLLPVSSSMMVPRGEDPLPQLESLTIIECEELVQVPCYPKRLKKLTIISCTKLSCEKLAGLTNLTELKNLRLYGCTNWRALPDSIGHLSSLDELEIDDCPGIESFPECLQQRLPSLRSLKIYDCPALERRCRRGGDYWHLVSHIPRTACFSTGKYQESSKSESSLRRLLMCGRS